MKKGESNYVALRHLRQKRHEQLPCQPLQQAHQSLAAGEHPKGARPHQRWRPTDEGLHILLEERQGRQGGVSEG
ncbi:MAG: hypothetical protein OXFUSZZB_001703 [Candidatus Fervidibacter sp.]|jgi:hypothetical protein